MIFFLNARFHFTTAIRSMYYWSTYWSSWPGAKKVTLFKETCLTKATNNLIQPNIACPSLVNNLYFCHYIKQLPRAIKSNVLFLPSYLHAHLVLFIRMFFLAFRIWSRLHSLDTWPDFEMNILLLYIVWKLYQIPSMLIQQRNKTIIKDQRRWEEPNLICLG